MKKIVSILLALALVLTSAMAVNAAELGARGFTASASNADVTVYPDSDYTTTGSPFQSITWMNLNKSTCTGFTADSGYDVRAKNFNSNETMYYIKSRNNTDVATQHSAYYSSWYNTVPGTYNDVGTLRYEGVGSVNNRSVDVELHIDSIIAQGGYTDSPGIAFLLVDSASTWSRGTYGKIYGTGTNQSEFKNHSQIQLYVTAKVKYHGTNTLVTGYNFAFNANDVDYGDPSIYPLQEAFTAGSGFTNHYYVFDSCFLVDTNEGDYVKWTAPASSASGVQGASSQTYAGVYALTDGSGQFSFALTGGVYGTAVTISQDASVIMKGYAVNYDANGGAYDVSGDVTFKTDPSHYQGDTVTVLGTSSDGYLPTRTGYTFDGWSTTQDGSVNRAVGSTFTMPAENVTLYAQWTNAQLPNPPYILYYDRNTLLKKIKITDNSETHTITANPIATGAESGLTGIVDGLPTREGYLFAGWYTSASAAVGRTAGDAYRRSFTISDYQSSADDNVELYAGWVPVSDVTVDAADDKNYGTSTLGGFSMQGVQVRAPELLEIYQPDAKNKVNPGIRFVTVYNKTMLNQLGALKPQAFTCETGDIPVYESGAVRYGYVLSANLVGLTDLNWDSTGAKRTDCTKDDHNRDHRNFRNYILSTTVIKYDGATDPETYGGVNIEARAFVAYTDCNGYQRVRYSTYGTGRFAGGCRTSYNAALAWAELHRV